MDNTITIICGARGSGKTPHIVGGDEEPGMAKIYLDKGMSTLVIDTLQHHKYDHVPVLQPKDYGRLSSHPGVYKTLVKVQDIKKFFSDGHLNHVWNTQIIFEDAYKYIRTQSPLSDPLVALLGDSKQQNNDLRFMFWCWALIHPDLMRMTNFYTIFKTTDGPEWRKDYLSGCYAQCLKAHQLVLAGKKRFITVDSGM